MPATVSCLASSSEQTDKIVRDLHADGIEQERISVLLPDPRRPKQFNFENDGPMEHGPVVGVGTGAAMGSILGWITGLAALAIPGVGPFLAAGPILAALGTATVGAIAGALVGMGMPEAQASYYESRLQEGRFLIWVEVRDRSEIYRIMDIFTRQQAEDITRSAAATEMLEKENIPSVKSC